MTYNLIWQIVIACVATQISCILFQHTLIELLSHFYNIQYTCRIKCNTQFYKLIQYLDLSTAIIRQNVWFCHGLIHNYKYINNREINYTFADENWAQQIHSNKNATSFININIVALKLENRIWIKRNCITWWC